MCSAALLRNGASTWTARRGCSLDADEPDWKWPARYGYALVGRIAETGADVEGLEVGDLVFSLFSSWPARHRPRRQCHSARRTGEPRARRLFRQSQHRL